MEDKGKSTNAPGAAFILAIYGTTVYCVLLPANRNPIVLPRSLLGQNNPQLRTHRKPKGDFCFEVSRIHSDLNGSNLTSQILEISLCLSSGGPWPQLPLARLEEKLTVSSLDFYFYCFCCMFWPLLLLASKCTPGWVSSRPSPTFVDSGQSLSLANCHLGAASYSCNAMHCNVSTMCLNE